MQMRHTGQYNGKGPISLAHVSKPLITAITAIRPEISVNVSKPGAHEQVPLSPPLGLHPTTGVDRAILGTKFRAQKLNTFIQSNCLCMTMAGLSLLDARSFSSREQESDSNESFGLTSSDRFLSTSRNSSQDDS